MNINIDLVIVIIYLLVTLMIGIWRGQGIKNIKEYAVGNQDFSIIAIVATVFATFVGAGTTSGLIERIHGISILFILLPIPNAIQRFAIAKYIVPRLMNFQNIISSGDLMFKLYGKNAKIITGIVTFIRAMGSIAAQITAIGLAFSYFLNIDFFWGVITGASIVVIYSASGGIKAVAFTDVFQFMILIIGFPLICNLGLMKAGGYSGLFDSLSNTNLNISFSEDFFLLDILPLLMFYVLSLDAPMLQRMLLNTSTKKTQLSLVISALVEIPFIYVVLLIGVIGIVLYPSIESKLVFPHIVNNLLPIGFKGMVIAGILAVTMSTADSYLNTSSIGIIHDTFKPLLNIKNELFFAKVLTVISGSFAIIISLYFADIIKILLTINGVWSSTVMIPILFGILGITISPKQLSITIFLGAAAYLFWGLILKNFLISSLIIGLVVNIMLFFSFYLYNKINKKNINNDTTSHNINKTRIFDYQLNKSTLSIFNIKKLLSYPRKVVENYGAPYMLFATFFICSYFIPFFMWSDNFHTEYDNLISSLRIFSGIICFPLLLHRQWPHSLKQYLPLYWFLCITYCLPFMTITMALINSISNLWLVNIALAILFTNLLVDWCSFLLIFITGISSSFLFSSHIGTNINLNSQDIYYLSYVYIFAILISSLFSRNRDHIHNQIIKYKNMLNEQLEKKVEERTFSTKEALAVKTRFLNNMSHEIRIPLSSVNGLAEITYDSWDKLSDTERKDCMKKIYESGQRLQKLALNLLDLSAINATKMALNKKKHNIEQLTNLVIEEFNHVPNKPEIFVTVKDGFLPEAYVDEIRISQVIRNLIANSIRYGKGSNIYINISHIDLIDDNLLVIDKEKDTIEALKFSVKDNGIGIPENELIKIFDISYESTRTRNNAGGTGLGLAICKEIIKVGHKGKIYAENNKNMNGCTITFTIPLKTHNSKIIH